ncbi:MAG TPA: NAD(P)H-dependent oxidoreductase subunit E [Thermoanaerobaculia bacterium]|nr:NAD(P)H-dependent oxidoreductase subunit E [Thermoanaerobaculia bacterium]
MSEPVAEGRRGLPPEAREELHRLRPLYPTARALTLPALHLAQRAWGGWLPEEAILAVAEELQLPAAEVYGVVTFYDLFHEQPVGRHRIRVCTNVPCMLRGSAEVMATLGELLGVEEGEVTADGRCSFVHFECLGACEHAPMMMVDDTYHYDLDRETVRSIVEGLE